MPTEGQIMNAPKPVTKRIRLKTSCTECQRRRKKCNRGKPCTNCARRYPPVECAYTQKPRPSVGNDASILSSVAKPPRRLALLPQPEDHSTTLPPISTLNLPSLRLRSLPDVLPKGEVNGRNEVAIKPAPEEDEKLPIVTQTSLSTRAGLAASRPDSPRSLSYGFLNMLQNLSVDATLSNAELFHLYFGGILPSLWSIDSTFPAPPIINDFWIPFMTSSPIIVHANLLRAAIHRAAIRSISSNADQPSNPLHGFGSRDCLEILTLKSKSISLLNARLRSPVGLSVDDEAIVSVIFFFYNEWCWGVKDSFSDLNPHAKGLQEMVRIRGGIRNIHSPGGFLAQFVMLVNYQLAIILERELFICPATDHDFLFDPKYSSAKTGLESPLYRPEVAIGDDMADWKLDDVTTTILQDLSGIIATIRSYMFGEIPEIKKKKFFTEINDKLTCIFSLPSLPSVDKSIMPEALIYECCRLTAIIYYRSLLGYIPFSVACTSDDLESIYSMINLIPSSRWKQIQGIWLWVVCAINPAASYRQEGLRLRMFLKTVTSSLGLADWQILINNMESFLALQRWIRQQGNVLPLGAIVG